MALVSVSLISISLVWAGTHQIGLMHMAGGFSLIDWSLSLGLLLSGGFLLASLLIEVDIRRRFDAWAFTAIGGIPTAVIAYGIYSGAFGPVRVLDKALGWAEPYGYVAMGLLIGFALAAAVKVKPPEPIVSDESLAVLTLPEAP